MSRHQFRSCAQVRRPTPESFAMFLGCPCCFFSFACFSVFTCIVLDKSLCHLSGLVCDLLLRWLKGYSAESALPEGHSGSQSERALRGGHPSHCALPTLLGRHHGNGLYDPW